MFQAKSNIVQYWLNFCHQSLADRVHPSQYKKEIKKYISREKQCMYILLGQPLAGKFWLVSSSSVAHRLNKSHNLCTYCKSQGSNISSLLSKTNEFQWENKTKKTQKLRMEYVNRLYLCKLSLFNDIFYFSSI